MKKCCYLQVMAMAMAEAGQIKLHGEKPTVAEAALARARKNVFKEERYSLVGCFLPNLYILLISF